MVVGQLPLSRVYLCMTNTRCAIASIMTADLEVVSKEWHGLIVELLHPCQLRIFTHIYHTNLVQVNFLVQRTDKNDNWMRSRITMLPVKEWTLTLVGVNFKVSVGKV